MTFFRRFVCLTPAIVVVLSVLVLYCDETSFVAGSTAKQCGKNNHHYLLCHTSKSRIDAVLNHYCFKRRKRAQAQSGRFIPRFTCWSDSPRVSLNFDWFLVLSACCVVIGQSDFFNFCFMTLSCKSL